MARNRSTELASRSRAQEIADDLAAQIESEIPTGTRIGTKEDLRLSTGAAMGTINEATRLLQERGLVTMRPGPRGGIFAATPSPMVRIGQTLVAVRDKPTMSEASAIRDALDPLVVVAAARDRTRKDIRDLNGLVAAMEQLIDDDEGFLRSNWLLHERIARTIKADLLRNIYLGVHGILEEQLKSVVPNTKSLEYKKTRLEVHRALVESIAARDEKLALDAVHSHAQETIPFFG